MNVYNSLLLFSVLSLLFACTDAPSQKKVLLGEHKVFKVIKTKEKMLVDGKMTEAIWEKAETRELNNFYRFKVPSDKQQSTFSMVWDEKNLYVFFHFEDKFITARETKRDGQPYMDDCGELFIIPVPDSLDSHIGFEVNPYLAANDFIFFNNYYQGKYYVFKAFNPDYKVETHITGTLNNNTDEDKSWTLEMAIPLSIFYSQRKPGPVKKGNKWAFMAVRNDRNELKGNRIATSTLFPIYDISKDVHQSNHFGLMEFVE